MGHTRETRSRRVWPVLGVAAVLGLVAAAPATEPAPPGTLSGTVVGPDGTPVAGARVSLNWIGRKVPAEARTDAEGRFRLGPMERVYCPRFVLNVDADGLPRGYISGDHLAVFPGCDRDLGTIQLDRGRVFTGQVLDTHSKPRSGATVECEVYRRVMGNTVHSVGPTERLTTDAEGRFRTPPLPVGLLALRVQPPDRQLASVRRLIRPGGEEALEPIRLEKDIPVSGVVKDEEGRPIEGVSIGGTVGHEATTDAEGKFTLHGFGPNPNFQMNVSKAGYAGLVGRVVITEAGIRWHVVRGSDAKDPGPVKELAVVMKRAGWFERQAVDADTGEPVRLDQVVICFFTRKPDGEVVLQGCRGNAFEQPEPGRFRVSFFTPDEYHLAFSAAGYHDAEAFTPKVTELKTVGGIVVKMAKKTEGSTRVVARQTIAGAVTRDGRPVRSGWVALWTTPGTPNTVNAFIMRGRTAEGYPIAYASTPLRDGAYILDVPFQGENWYVVAEEPGHALTQVGPLTIALNETRKLDIACTEGGRIRGRVRGVPEGWEGHVWVVAFTRTGVRAETRADKNGAFTLPPLPPGEYGLKAGHDAYEDPEVPRGENIPHEAFQTKADPWKRAKVVTLESGRDLSDVEVEWPR